MSLDFSHKGQCQVTMHDYIDGILQGYGLTIKDHNNEYQIVEKAPDDLFVVNEDCKKAVQQGCSSFPHYHGKGSIRHHKS
jgi:hypothetical protein